MATVLCDGYPHDSESGIKCPSTACGVYGKCKYSKPYNPTYTAGRITTTSAENNK